MRVVTELTAGLPSIRGDRVQLQQVLINLVLNAVDAMSQPAKNCPTLTLRSGRMGDSVQISVVDRRRYTSGCRRNNLPLILTTKSQGLGLGLSLSRSILIAHGGRLWAENQATGGAAFYCTMPEWKGDGTLVNAGDTSISA